MNVPKHIDAKNEERVARRVAYAGVRRGSSVPLIDVFMILSDGGQVTGQRFSVKADRARRVIGAVYDVDFTPDLSQMYTGSLKYVEQLEGDEPAGWKAKSDTIIAANRIATAERRAKAAGDALRGLDPLRKVWRASVGYDRAALEALVLSYLRGKGA